jgi:hypothetical protein
MYLDPHDSSAGIWRASSAHSATSGTLSPGGPHICSCCSILWLDFLICSQIPHSHSIAVFQDRTIAQKSIAMAPVATTLRSETSDNAFVGAIGKTTSGKPLKVRAYPKFDSLEEERLYRKQHLAAAYRVFAERGFDEGVAGHISVRDPILTDHFCKFYQASPSSG